MPGITVPVEFEIISPDGKIKIRVVYPPGASKAQRRALRRAARREYFRLTGTGSLGNRRKKRRRSKFFVSGSISRYRRGDSPQVIAALTHAQQTIGKRRDFQSHNQTGSVAVSNGDLWGASNQGWECLDQINPGPPYRAGGPFKLVKYKVGGAEVASTVSFGDKSKPNNNGDYSLVTSKLICGSTWVGESFGSYQSKSINSLPDLSAYHSLAWDRLKPTVPKANATQFIYELRDLPRMLELSRSTLARIKNTFEDGFARDGVHNPLIMPRRVADNYLNFEFGWLPFLSDLKNFLEVWKATSDHIARTVRDNGQWVKRRRMLEEQETDALVSRLYTSDTVPNESFRNWKGSVMSRVYQLDGFSIRGHTDFRLSVKKRVWAVGSFKYYRPEFDSTLPYFDSSAAYVLRLLTLYGIRVNPAVLWRLVPWTWLIDWFTSFGKYFDRLHDFVEDGIVSRYLYVMSSETHVMRKICHMNFYDGPVTVMFERTFNMKQRDVADSPYGFNSPWNSLSPRQMAILGAVGIGRTPRGFVSRG